MVREFKLHSHFAVADIVMPLIREKKYDLALTYVHGQPALYAAVIRMVGVDGHNPSLALKYIARFGLKPAHFPEVILESKKKVLR